MPDMKGPGAAFVRERLGQFGVDLRVVHTGCMGERAAEADVSREVVFAASEN